MTKRKKKKRGRYGRSRSSMCSAQTLRRSKLIDSSMGLTTLYNGLPGAVFSVNELKPTSFELLRASRVEAFAVTHNHHDFMKAKLILSLYGISFRIPVRSLWSCPVSDRNIFALLLLAVSICRLATPMSFVPSFSRPIVMEVLWIYETLHVELLWVLNEAPPSPIFIPFKAKPSFLFLEGEFCR